MVKIYVLELTDGKYYVGKTNNEEERILSHFSENGSAWTKKYKPIKVIETIDGDEWDEDKYTKIYMKKYGIDNVRGGSYSTIYLDKNIIKLIEKEIMSTDDACFRCGKKGHFINDCYEDVDIEEVTYNKCLRCGRYGHEKNQCFAKTHIKGYYFRTKNKEKTYYANNKNNNSSRCIIC